MPPREGQTALPPDARLLFDVVAFVDHGLTLGLRLVYDMCWYIPRSIDQSVYFVFSFFYVFGVNFVAHLDDIYVHHGFGCSGVFVFDGA